PGPVQSPRTPGHDSPRTGNEALMQQPHDVNTHPVTRPANADVNLLGTGPLAIVGGCGHVGLPLGLAFARKGYQVDLFDTSAERAAQVNRGEMPFHEDDAEALLKDALRSGLLKATTDTAALEDASAIIVTIGTPVDE